MCYYTCTYVYNKNRITLSLYFKALMFMFYKQLGFGILDTKIKDKYKDKYNKDKI